MHHNHILLMRHIIQKNFEEQYNIPSPVHPILLWLKKFVSWLQWYMLETSPAEPSRTLGHGISNTYLLWLYASSGLDELSQAFQCKLAYLPCQLHDTLEGNAATLLPALQIQNPSNVRTDIRLNQPNHVSSASQHRTHVLNFETYKHQNNCTNLLKVKRTK